MKLHYTLALVALGLVSIAQANTVSQVKNLQVAFGCDGATPDTSVLGMNYYVANHGGRIEAPIAFENNEFILHTQAGDVILGTLASNPTCIELDNGDPYTASWNDVKIADGVSMTEELTTAGDVTFTVTDKAGKAYVANWKF